MNRHHPRWKEGSAYVPAFPSTYDAPTCVSSVTPVSVTGIMGSVPGDGWKSIARVLLLDGLDLMNLDNKQKVENIR